MRFALVFTLMTIGLIAFGQQTDILAKFVESENLPNNDMIYESFACEEKASFPGGDAEMMKYIAEHFKCTEEMLENGIEDRIHIRLIITKTGEIGGVKVLRNVYPLIEKEYIRVIKSMPRWSPAKIGDSPVNSWFIIPISLIIQ